MLQIDDLKEGQVVKVRTSFGGGQIVVGIVQNVHDDIKNGLPGIDYSVDGDECWAYLDQVVAVVQTK